MNDCCPKPSSHRLACPACHNTGKPVSARTLRHHLRFPDNSKIIDDCEYSYCKAPDCQVVYFWTDNHVNQQQLHSWPLIKQNLLCYCFAISIQHYQSALQSGNANEIKLFVKNQTKNGQCACEVRNPGGHCCLAEFSQIEKKQQ